MRTLNRNLENGLEAVEKENKKKKAYLCVIEGAQYLGVEDGHKFIVGEKCTLGRSADNSIKIEDPFSSSHHAEIVRRKGKYYLLDLQSKNGTLLNGDKVLKEMPLKKNDVIAIGNVKVRFELE